MRFCIKVSPSHSGCVHLPTKCWNIPRWISRSHRKFLAFEFNWKKDVNLKKCVKSKDLKAMNKKRLGKRAIHFLNMGILSPTLFNASAATFVRFLSSYAHSLSLHSTIYYLRIHEISLLISPHSCWMMAVFAVTAAAAATSVVMLSARIHIALVISNQKRRNRWADANEEKWNEKKNRLSN